MTEPLTKSSTEAKPLERSLWIRFLYMLNVDSGGCLDHSGSSAVHDHGSSISIQIICRKTCQSLDDLL
jgi:hypothetical protein